MLWKDNWTNQYENELKNMEFWASESEWDEFVNTVWILPCFFMTMPKISLQRKSKKYCWQLWNKQSNIFKRFSGNKLNRRYQIILPVVLLDNISIHFFWLVKIICMNFLLIETDLTFQIMIRLDASEINQVFLKYSQINPWKILDLHFHFVCDYKE